MQREANRVRSAMANSPSSLACRCCWASSRFHFVADGERCYNSAAYVARDGPLLGWYDKMHLVMFGEYAPFVRVLPLAPAFYAADRSARAGRRPTRGLRRGRRSPVRRAFRYESVLSHVIRRQVNALTAEGRRPDLLVNLTNDGWFWGSSELDLHLACGVFRAVECRKPLLIAANTGFSAWIDGDGRIHEQGPRRATGVIVAAPRLDDRTSWYLVHGDWFAGACLAVCGWCGLVGIHGRWRRGRQAGDSGPLNPLPYAPSG